MNRKQLNRLKRVAAKLTTLIRREGGLETPEDYLGFSLNQWDEARERFASLFQSFQEIQKQFGKFQGDEPSSSREIESILELFYGLREKLKVEIEEIHDSLSVAESRMAEYEHMTKGKGPK